MGVDTSKTTTANNSMADESKAGIGVGSAVFLVIVMILVVVLVKKLKYKNKRKKAAARAEVDANPVYGLDECDADPQAEVQDTNDYYDCLYEEGTSGTRDNNSTYGDT